MSIMVLELDRTYYREVTPVSAVWFTWLALALAISACGAILAVGLGPVAGLPLAALALGMVVGLLAWEVRERCKRMC